MAQEQWFAGSKWFAMGHSAGRGARNTSEEPEEDWDCSVENHCTVQVSMPCLLFCLLNIFPFTITFNNFMSKNADFYLCATNEKRHF